MGERILVPYDGSASADHAVEEAMALAVEQRASLYILGIAPEDGGSEAAALPVGARITDDLVTFARLGARLGIEVDGSYLAAPTDQLLRSAIEMHHINQVVMARDEKADANSRNGRLLQALAAHCPVPVTVLR